MIIFPDFRRILGKKMQGLRKIDHNSRKNLKLKGEKLNSSKKLKVSAKFGKRQQKLSQIKGENQGTTL